MPRILLSLSFLFVFISSYAQVSLGPGIEINSSVEYEVGAIIVTGADNLDHTVITLLSGISVGDKITIPGDKLSQAVKNLWSQRLFEDIRIKVVQKNGSVISLEYALKELPKLSKFYFTGIKKSKQDDIREEINLTRGSVVTENLIITTQNKIRRYYVDKGYLNAVAKVTQENDKEVPGAVILKIDINPGERIKIKNITFTGNENIPSGELRGEMEETKRYAWFNFFRSSKLLKKEYEADKKKIIDFYNQKGYRDMRILSDSIYPTSDDRIMIHMNIDEGRKYYFRNISYIGNTKYSTETLKKIVRLNKGDVFDTKLLSQRVSFDPDGVDISSLYLNNGYLFSSVTPVETQIVGDSIDVEIRIREGRQATINKVTIVGNDRTNDHVIYRELRTRPGDLFSRADIQRTIRELANLGYFDPQSLNVNPQPNPETGTVDLEYTVVERSTSQLELQGGWGGYSIVGTIGLSFNNFSARNLFNGKAWKPLPSGDGQSINIRAQTNGTYYQSYSFSFTEPWLGGKKPNSFTFSFYHNIQDYSSTTAPQKIKITGVNFGLGTRLKWPDDYFTMYHGIELRQFDVNGYRLVDNFNSGIANNINYQLTIARDNRDMPIFPTRGSKIQFSLELTPPVSLLDGRDYSKLDTEQKYKFIEYHKWKFNADFYTEIAKNTVFRAYGEFGFLGSYNKAYGLPPFERFYLGGSGLQNFVLDGREIVALRGYSDYSIDPTGYGGALYNKFTMELRYLISPNPNAQIFALTFMDAGNNFASFQDYRPFELKRSLGGGVRIFMPMFGLLGFDMGYGFDPNSSSSTKSGWQTHFIIGQQF